MYRAGLFLSQSGGAAYSPLRVIANGKDITTAVNPIIIDGRTYIQARPFAEALNANVRWDPETTTVYADSSPAGQKPGNPVVPPGEQALRWPLISQAQVTAAIEYGKAKGALKDEDYDEPWQLFPDVYSELRVDRIMLLTPYYEIARLGWVAGFRNGEVPAAKVEKILAEGSQVIKFLVKANYTVDDINSGWVTIYLHPRNKATTPIKPVKTELIKDGLIELSYAIEEMNPGEVYHVEFANVPFVDNDGKIRLHSLFYTTKMPLNQYQ
ncbi:MAG: copper amine oxidase N-terminal domain-containing protein [Heliobacteriaceae bacterium]|nr:copper amine oxidase N-terminal domain-containing protein [Heliobacteriaceae bacterium]